MFSKINFKALINDSFLSESEKLSVCKEGKCQIINPRTAHTRISHSLSQVFLYKVVSLRCAKWQFKRSEKEICIRTLLLYVYHWRWSHHLIRFESETKSTDSYHALVFKMSKLYWKFTWQKKCKFFKYLFTRNENNIWTVCVVNFSEVCFAVV